MWHWVGGRRLKAFIWFLVGAAISFLPLAWLAVLAPRQMFFNTFEYHFFYRFPDHSGTLHNLRTIQGLIGSSQFLLVIMFAGIGLLFVLGRSQWHPKQKAEFYLCGWLAAGVAVFLAKHTITYEQYFVLLVPLLSILASVGIMATASGLRQPGGPIWLIIWVLALYLVGFPHWLSHRYHNRHWSHIEEIAKLVNDVTPADRLIWTHETIYFAARRIPPAGLEHYDALKLRLSPGDSAQLHVASHADVMDRAAAGRFATIALWATIGYTSLESSGIRQVYGKHTQMFGCDVFWSSTSEDDMSAR